MTKLSVNYWTTSCAEVWLTLSDWKSLRVPQECQCVVQPLSDVVQGCLAIILLHCSHLILKNQKDTWQRRVLNDQLIYITCADPRAVTKQKHLTVDIRSVTCLPTSTTQKVQTLMSTTVKNEPRDLILVKGHVN